MNVAEDDGIKLQKTAALSLAEFERLLNLVLWKRSKGSFQVVHRRVREIDVDRIFNLIEPFQEDPQLLDSHLRNFIPPLVSAYLQYLQTSPRPLIKKTLIPLSHAVLRILNLFSKVRGEKVIAGFLNNEPRHLEPILTEFEKGENFIQHKGNVLSLKIVPWEERYVLLLWLSHLMLAPFPLSSMSVVEASKEVSADLGIDLPPQLPGVCLHLLPICIRGLQSATKERAAAAALLVRLSTRPDMQKIGLLDALVNWALTFFKDASETKADIHRCLGVLSFLSGLVSSATNQEIGPFLPAIYQSSQEIINQDTLSFVRSSAVARKLVVKILRNIVVHSLQSPSNATDLDTTNILEESIQFFLDAVGDADTPVRYSASKALSVVTLQLESDMAGEIVEAILASFNENVYWQGSKRNLSGVNPLAWHGLTLTLAHLLYRRAPGTYQLPDILNALLLALTFEQRSATGGSMGTNVRDAACFGLWAISRRYSTEDLIAVDTASIRAFQEAHQSLSVPQGLAIELLVVACLDPAGNIRRGSSAALQELIGRHPNTIVEGIPLVQIVDFHAVGLRDRAMVDVAVKAAELHQMYWEALFHNILEWRGVGSLDTPSRLSAAKAVGRLSISRPFETIRGMTDKICDRLKALASREIEERHGLIMSLSCLLEKVVCQFMPSKGSVERTKSDLHSLSRLWTLFEGVLKVEDRAFTSVTMRPELTATAVCDLLASLGGISIQLTINGETVRHLPDKTVIHLLELCLARNEDSILQMIPRAAATIYQLLDATTGSALIQSWLTYLENEASYSGSRGSGVVIALGAVWSQLPANRDKDDSIPYTLTADQVRILQVLTFRCTSAVGIAARTVALQALRVLHDGLQNATPGVIFDLNVRKKIAGALHTALNDYTVTERGDVGSLVRLEALSTFECAWQLLRGAENERELYADVLRLSLEKLDKVRDRATRVLASLNISTLEKNLLDTELDLPRDPQLVNLSSYEYFSARLKLIPYCSPQFQVALLLGYTSAAGMGSESVVQNSRLAFITLLNTLPVTSNLPNECSLQTICTLLTNLLKANLENDRVLIPLMDTVAFLLDMQILHGLIDTSFPFRTLLSLTQKSHFKSTNMQKLHVAMDVYRGLGTIPTTRRDTVTKVASMLLHPFPKIRVTAAETLWVLTGEEDLKGRDWSGATKRLKEVVEGIRGRIVV